MKFHKGFTLIELLVVISIIGLLSSTVVASLSSARDRARLASGKTQSAHLYRSFGADPSLQFEFEEASGNAADSNGRGSCVMFGNTSRSTDTPSGAGRSLQLVDGIGDGCSFSTVNSDLVDSVNEGKRFTFSVWYKPSGLPQNTYDGYIFYRAGFHEGIGVRKSDNRAFGLVWYGNGTNIQLLAPSPLQTDKWHHIALAVDSVANVAELFMDGKSVDRRNLSSTDPLMAYNNTRPFSVGGSGGGYDGYGYIDEARFYTQAFSLADAERVYAEGLKKLNFARK